MHQAYVEPQKRYAHVIVKGVISPGEVMQLGELVNNPRLTRAKSTVLLGSTPTLQKTP